VFCISTKGRYSTRILVLLAMAGPDKILTKNEIAELEGLTPGYVQQLTSYLQTAGLVVSYRGKQGGFKLALRRTASPWPMCFASPKAISALLPVRRETAANERRFVPRALPGRKPRAPLRFLRADNGCAACRTGRAVDAAAGLQGDGE